MATSRTRTMVSIPSRTGYWDHGGGNIVRYNLAPKIKTTKDVIGNRGGQNPFTSSARTEENGLRITSFDGKADFPVSPPNGAWYSAPAESTYVSRIMASTGPLTPKMYLPNSIFELKDIPMMLRHAGDLLHKIRLDRAFRHGLDPLKEAASATLATQFGWRPLIEDMGKMLAFAEVVERQQKILRGAHSTRGIRRRITLVKDTQTLEGTQLVHSTWGLFMSPRFKDTNTIDRWATMRWTVRDQTQIGTTPSFGEAFKVAYGLNKGYIPINVWKSLPWSWAIDWFADISNKLAASHNMVYYKPSQICIMTTRVVDRKYYPLTVGQYTFSGGNAKSVWKERTIHPPVNTLSLRLPYLDNFKLSILGSFSILKLSRMGR